MAAGKTATEIEYLACIRRISDRLGIGSRIQDNLIRIFVDFAWPAKVINRDISQAGLRHLDVTALVAKTLCIDLNLHRDRGVANACEACKKRKDVAHAHRL